MKTPALVFFLAAAVSIRGQGVLPASGTAGGAAPPVTAKTASPPPASQTTLDRLAQNNQELLDLLKKQQAVLEDIQYDRRLQNRQIQLVEGRLEDTLQQNATLQAKVNELEAAAANAASHSPAEGAPAAVDKTSPPPVALSTPPPASYLPPPETPGALGTISWQRLFTLSGEDGKDSEVFHIQGKRWRVLWHNQDKPGETYKNTSALFISAFPQDDPIPKKICSKLGSGGDTTELAGPGDYHLKVEASGGHWEAAVEDFR